MVSVDVKPYATFLLRSFQSYLHVNEPLHKNRYSFQTDFCLTLGRMAFEDRFHCISLVTVVSFVTRQTTHTFRLTTTDTCNQHSSIWSATIWWSKRVRTQMQHASQQSLAVCFRTHPLVLSPSTMVQASLTRQLRFNSPHTCCFISKEFIPVFKKKKKNLIH